MPHFQGQAQPMIEASERARSVRQSKTDEHLNAVAQMTEKYNAELGRV
jgi:limonene 1,2-monooxygenase